MLYCIYASKNSGFIRDIREFLLVLVSLIYLIRFCMFKYNMMSNLSSNKCVNNKRVFNSRTYKKLREKFIDFISKNRIGFTHTTDTKLKISLALKGKQSVLKGKTYDEIFGSERSEIIKNKRSLTAKARTDYNDPTRCKKLSEREITEEWRSGISIANKGRIHISNGSNRKSVKPEDLVSYTLNGWKLGW